MLNPIIIIKNPNIFNVNFALLAQAGFSMTSTFATFLLGGTPKTLNSPNVEKEMFTDKMPVSLF